MYIMKIPSNCLLDQWPVQWQEALNTKQLTESPSKKHNYQYLKNMNTSTMTGKKSDYHKPG